VKQNNRQIPSALVSVIVPAYSRVPLLRECLASIRAQTWPYWECIVVDDASPWGEEICAVVQAMEDRRFRYIRRQENAGPAAARNTGIGASRGEFFVCVDEDDRLVPRAIEKLLGEILQRNCDVVCPQAAFFEGKSGIRRAILPSVEQVLVGMWVLPNGWIMKRGLWQRLGGYDESPILLGRDDWEFWIRVVAHWAKVAVLDEVLYEYRIPIDSGADEPSLEHRVRRQEVGCAAYVIAKHRSLYVKHPMQKRVLLQRSCRLEAEYHERKGCLYRAALRRCQEAWYGRDAKSVRRAVKAILRALVGERRLESMLRWKRQIVGALRAQSAR